MWSSPLIDQLVDAFRCLPGVGPKTAQRMMLHVLERDRSGAEQLSLALQKALAGVGHCQQCRNLSEQDVCRLCSNPKRDRRQLCIVETPSDLMAIEQAGSYRGLYFILMGHLSPIDGIGPEDIGIDQLEQRIRDEACDEVILATNPTVEGEATAHYITMLVKQLGVGVSRIAHGVPVGGELEYLDNHTLTHAFSERKAL